MVTEKWSWEVEPQMVYVLYERKLELAMDTQSCSCFTVFAEYIGVEKYSRG